MTRKLFLTGFVLECILLVVVGLLSSGCFALSAGSNANSSPDSGENRTADQNSNQTQSNVIESAEQKKEVLWDFRTEEPKPQKFSKAETQAVLKYLFDDTWDKDLEISSRFSGSFSKPNANETLYYVGGCNEDDGAGFKSTLNCAHVSWWNAGWIAIYDGSTPVMKIDAALGYGIGKVSDVNGDGISEIFSLSGYSNQGETDTGGALGQVVDGKYKEIKTFSGATDTCGADPVSARSAKASVISYFTGANGKMPDFVEEYFQNKCGKTPWKKITKKQFESQ